MDDDGQILVVQMFVQQVAQLRLRPHKVYTHRQSAAGEYRPAYLRFGSLVGAYCVKRNVDEHILLPYNAARHRLLGFFLDVDDRTSLVGATFGTGPVG